MTQTRRLFGTDGIRGRANTDPMTAEVALRLGQAAGLMFTRGQHRHRVVIGKDTRLSGYMLEPALVAGFIGAGMDVTLVGPLPTPAIAMLTRSLRADLGVMISASHNPYRGQRDQAVRPRRLQAVRRDRAGDRDPDGRRPFAASGRPRRARPRRAAGGCRRPLHRGGEGELPARPAAGRAEDRRRLRARRRLPRRADGAVGAWAPTVIPVGVSPDGFNINRGCGSTATDFICAQVLEHRRRSRPRAGRRRRPPARRRRARAS